MQRSGFFNQHRNDFIDIAVQGLGAALCGCFIPKISARDACIFTLATAIVSKAVEKYFKGYDDLSKKMKYPLVGLVAISAVCYTLLKLPISTILSLIGMAYFGERSLTEFRTLFPYRNEQKIGSIDKVAALFFPLQQVAIFLIGSKVDIKPIDIMKVRGIVNLTYKLNVVFSAFLSNKI